MIPVLLLKGSGLYKTTAFGKPVYVGDPLNAVKIFNEKEVDELVLLDIDATRESKEINYDLISEIAGECFMPVTYGGGIRSLDQIKKLLWCGIEKVCINTKAMEEVNFVQQAVEQYGGSTIVISLDTKKDFWGKYGIYSNGGEKRSKLKLEDFTQTLQKIGIGEIFLNSIDNDGKRCGYDLEIIKFVSQIADVPLVVCGGASGMNDFRKAIEAGADAVAAGSKFVFVGKHRAVLINYLTNEELDDLNNLKNTRNVQ